MAHAYDSVAAAESYIVPAESWTRVRNATLFVALAAWVAVAIGWAAEPEAFYQNYLVAFLFGIGTAIGATFFVMIQHLTGAAWSVTVRRLMEALMRTMPLFLLLFLPLPLGLHYLYAWSLSSAAHDPILMQKLGYLNGQWFALRGFLVIGLLSLWALVLYAKSRRQDATGAVKLSFSAERWSAPGVVVLFLGASAGAFDWIMSLDAHWYSTMFGVIFLAGGAVSFLAVLIIVCLWLRANGYLLNSVTTEHYHDLGKWLFALMVFWAYVSFSQYMLMWYGNLPEETIWFKHRLAGNWLVLSLVLVGGHFIVPFFAMLPRAVKRSRNALAFFASWLLVMHYADLYWQVMPVFAPQGLALHWLAPATLTAVLATMGLVFWSAFRERPLVAVGDPRLKQCLAFHNA
jgi:hypothetical protein